MQIHILQHVPFEDIGAIADWADRQQARLVYTRFYQGDELPPTPDCDLVIVMGGPMSVNDEGQHPWLPGEKIWLASAIKQEIPVLGICLGAQLIAAALEANVYPNAEREIG